MLLTTAWGRFLLCESWEAHTCMGWLLQEGGDTVHNWWSALFVAVGKILWPFCYFHWWDLMSVLFIRNDTSRLQCCVVLDAFFSSPVSEWCWRPADPAATLDHICQSSAVVPGWQRASLQCDPGHSHPPTSRGGSSRWHTLLWHLHIPVVSNLKDHSMSHTVPNLHSLCVCVRAWIESYNAQHTCSFMW